MGRWRPWRLAGLLSLAIVVAPSTATATMPVEAAASCVETEDLGRCLLRVLAGHEGGGNVLFDPELSTRADLLAEVGVSRDRLEAWFDGLGAGPRNEYLRLKYRAEIAAEDAARLDAAGGSPDEALAGVLALPHTDHPLRFSARAWACYRLAIRGDRNQNGGDLRAPVSEPMLRSVLEMWEPLVGPAILTQPDNRRLIARLWTLLKEPETARRVLFRRAPNDPDLQAQLAASLASMDQAEPPSRFLDRDLALRTAREAARNVRERLAIGGLKPKERLVLADEALVGASAAARAGDMALARTLLRQSVQLTVGGPSDNRTYGQSAHFFLLQVAKGDLRAKGLLPDWPSAPTHPR